MIKRRSPLASLGGFGSQFGQAPGKEDAAHEEPEAEARQEPGGEPEAEPKEAAEPEGNLTRLADLGAGGGVAPRRVSRAREFPALAPQEDTPPPAEAQAAAEPEPAPEPPAAEQRPKRRSSRVKTTFLGFERSDGRTEDVFEQNEEAPRAQPDLFPVGWLVIIDGPGRGHSLSIHGGVSQIGRGDDQAVQLDFGDTGISRSNHAAIAFDDEDRKFYLGHGGKANIVRLNGKPVLSTESLEDGDLIRIGETTMCFVAFCGEDFSWSDEGPTKD